MEKKLRMQYNKAMGANVSTSSIVGMRRFLENRDENEKRKAEVRRQALLKMLKETKIWKRYSGIQRVYLFGSILEGGSFHSTSDVDILIEGNTGEDYFALWGEIEDMLDWKTDLREVTAQSRLLETARRRGEKIYERKNPHS